MDELFVVQIGRRWVVTADRFSESMRGCLADFADEETAVEWRDRFVAWRAGLRVA